LLNVGRVWKEAVRGRLVEVETELVVGFGRQVNERLN
jgi:hypothetical protein